MFIDQSNIYPFPKVTPIRVPKIIQLSNKFIKEIGSPIDSRSEMKSLESIFRNWFNPLVDTNTFPYMYFTNNGITQGLETLALIYKNKDIKMLTGDYFWLKAWKSASELFTKESCDISYASSPSAINGNILDTTWDSRCHILDGAYIGSSIIKTTVPTNTDFLLLGFSKNLGLHEYRLGLILSKRPILQLEGIQKTFGYVGLHFFNAVSKICKEISILELASELKNYQIEFCKLHPELVPSDSALLSTTTDISYKFYKRPDGTIRVPLGESITYCIENNLI
jgi:hypothetical protein